MAHNDELKLSMYSFDEGPVTFGLFVFCLVFYCYLSQESHLQAGGYM